MVEKKKTEFELKKELIDYEHKLRMEELDFQRKTWAMVHQNNMELERVQNANKTRLEQMIYYHKNERYGNGRKP